MNSPKEFPISAGREGFTCSGVPGAGMKLRQPIKLSRSSDGKLNGSCQRALANNGNCGPEGPECPLSTILSTKELPRIIYVPPERSPSRRSEFADYLK